MPTSRVRRLSEETKMLMSINSFHTAAMLKMASVTATVWPWAK